VALVPFAAERPLAGVASLCRAEGWPSYGDPAVLLRAFAAPGVIAVVAVVEDAGDAPPGEAGTAHAEGVVGVAQAQGDGAVQSHLSLLVVAPHARRRGVGRRLVEEVLRGTGTRRMDLLAEAAAGPFYERFAHRRMAG